MHYRSNELVKFKRCENDPFKNPMETTFGQPHTKPLASTSEGIERTDDPSSGTVGDLSPMIPLKSLFCHLQSTRQTEQSSQTLSLMITYLINHIYLTIYQK